MSAPPPAPPADHTMAIMGGALVVACGVGALALYSMTPVTATPAAVAPGVEAPTAVGSAPTAQPDLLGLGAIMGGVTPILDGAAPLLSEVASTLPAAVVGGVLPVVVDIVTQVPAAIVGGIVEAVKKIPTYKTVTSCPGGYFFINSGSLCRTEKDRGTHQGGCRQWTCPGGWNDDGSRCWQTTSDWTEQRGWAGLAGICPIGYAIHNGGCAKWGVTTNYRDRDCAGYNQDANNCESGWLADGAKCYKTSVITSTQVQTN